MTDVATWLKELGLEHYEQAFRENEVTVAVLPELTEADLKELGLPLGPRKLLLKAIAALSEVTDAAPSTAPAPRAEAERRQLTVMFCDLVGSTALSAQLDPEDMREVVRAYQDACAGVITRFDGFVAKYMGDGVLAYFGYPRAHEDDAERAVRAGLALIEAVAKLATPTDQPLSARIGIATGLVVVGDLVGEGASQEQAVVGDTPNLAARLQGVAEPGQVVIADVTRRLLGAGFELEDLGAQALKGLDGPTGAFAVRGERATESRFEARNTKVMPMVGRDQELALLLERWAQAKTGEGQGVLLVAEAGIGKSRITRALLDSLAEEPHIRIRYQCSPYHAESALWPVIQQLTHAAGIGAEDGIDARLDKLEAMLGRAGDPTEAAPLIASLIGLDGEGRYGALGLTPQAQRARTLSQLIEQMLALSTQQPVLVVLEDAHWIDPTTLEMMEQCLDLIADARVLILLTSRPDNQPALAAHPHMTRLTLNRLGHAGAAAIIDRLRGNTAIPPETIAAIIARTDGVPLYVEELTKAVMETGETSETGEASVPASLHDSLMARLDRIPEVKEVAQIAACIGREFDYALLAAVSDRDDVELAIALDRLVAAELVFQRGRPPDATYTFKHALVRDAAYASLLRRTRQASHLLVARAMEAHFPHLVETSPELLAHHFSETTHTEQAVAYWLKAGQRAAQRSALQEAIAHLRQGLALLPSLTETPERAKSELVFQQTLGPAVMATQGYGSPEVAQTLVRSRELCELVGDTEEIYPVLFGAFLYALVRAEHKEACTAMNELVAKAQLAGNSAAHAAAVMSLGVDMVYTGQPSSARRHLEHAMAIYDFETHSPLAFRYGLETGSAANAHNAWCMWLLGYPDQALRFGDEAVALLGQIEHRYTQSRGLQWTAVFHVLRQDWPTVGEQVARAITLAEEHGFALSLAVGQIMQGAAAAKRREGPGGVMQIRAGLDAYQSIGARFQMPFFLALLADALGEEGKHDEGLAALVDATDLIETTGERFYEAEVHRLRGGLLLAASPRVTSQAETSFLHALDTARGQEAKMFELRAARDLARLWAERGDRQKAHDLLAPIYDWFTEGFDTPDLKDAKVLLEELG